ncbi:hypothetical protein C8J57DRAFT_1337242 [Mycena rebaudengoi]|nr:hypothetical protein C8J57DRAFT_1337242 [Mycena rebaudengoi]
MTLRNYTIDNISPLISYSPAGAWKEGEAELDDLTSMYQDETFTLCSTKGSSATFSFTGNQVWVFGAKRGNHGPYSITLDGTKTMLDGLSRNPKFKTTLFVSPVLAMGAHTITLTNELEDPNFPYLDLDAITWSTMGSASSQEVSMGDNDPGFTYKPLAVWNTDVPQSFSGFDSNTGHFATSAGATVSLEFTGDYVTVFGPVGPSIARYSVVLDGKPIDTFNATKTTYTPKVALYHGDNLGPGNHTLTLTAQPEVADQILAVDYAVVPVVSSSPLSQKKSRGSEVAIIASVVAGVCVLLLLGSVILFLRRRKRRSQGVVCDDHHSLLEVSPFLIPKPPSEWPYDHDARPSIAKSSPYSSSTRLATTAAVETVPQASTGPRRKPYPPVSPPTTSVSVVPVSVDPSRMQVPGREQDFGPLPPDYNQATEPFRAP